jgi:RimJ/RimL family protein N-acetyltransferase
MSALPDEIAVTSPFPGWAIPMAFGWAEKRRCQVADDFFPRTVEQFVEYSQRWYRTFGLWKNGSLSGAVAFERNSPVTVTAHILLSKRLFGMPMETLRAVAAAMFDSEAQLLRIQAFVPAWNKLAIALCFRLGARMEGVMASATLRAGKPAGVVLFGMIRGSVNGPELRREFVAEPGGELVDNQRNILPGPDGGTERGGLDAVVGSRGIERGGADAGEHGGAHGGEQLDEHDGERADGPGKPVPRGARLRKERANGTGHAAKRTRARKPNRK